MGSPRRQALTKAGFEFIWLAVYEHPRLECPPHDGAGICGTYPVLAVSKPGYPKTYHEHIEVFREHRGVPGQPPHPHAKSVEAIERLILAYSRPGDLVCDLFGRSGSTAIAACRTERRFIGGDLDPGSVQAARVAVSELTFGCDVDDKDRLIWDRIVDVDTDKHAREKRIILDDDVIGSERAGAYVIHAPRRSETTQETNKRPTVKTAAETTAELAISPQTSMDQGPTQTPALDEPL